MSTIGAAVLAGLAALLVLTLALAPSAEAYIYWTNSGNLSSIGRADLDASGVDPGFIPLGTENFQPVDLARDGSHIYWTWSDWPLSSGISRANLDGTGVEEVMTGINPIRDPVALAVDAEHVYWTWSECDDPAFGCSIEELQGGPSGGIARASLDGSGVEHDFITGIDPVFVAVDGSHIYWTGSVCNACAPAGDPTHVIGRANLNGTGVEPSFIDAMAGFKFGGFRGLALDASHIYWTGWLRDDAGYGPTLGRANLDGGSVDPAFIGGQLGCCHSPGWGGVAVDDAHLYWSESSYTGEESIIRANLDGSGLERLIVGGFEDGPYPDLHPGDLAVDALTKTEADGTASAAKHQRQTGKEIVVKVKVSAEELLTVTATGKIKVNPTYRLKPETVEVAKGERTTLRLEPKQRAAKKIVTALKRGDTAKAKVTVTLTDVAGNNKTEKLRVRLRR